MRIKQLLYGKITAMVDLIIFMEKQWIIGGKTAVIFGVTDGENDD